MKNVQNITKAVIPAAGLGKRFWPMTKIMPKELLPIVTRPSLHLILEEAQDAGLKEIILVLSADKEPMMAHLREFFPQMTFHFVEQKEPLGLGHAVGLATKKVGDETFVVLLPDTLIDHTTSATKQLLAIFKKNGQSVNAAEQVSAEEVQHFGAYEVASSEGRLHLAKRVVEKPKPGEQPSNLVVSGRYIFTPEIFSILHNTKPGRNNEIQLADAMNTLAGEEKLLAYEFEGIHFDIGNPVGFIQANIHYGVKEYGERIHQRFK
ncbi:MAG: sugar phosphate nucleotidyltransferase [Deltaproteobacteria bacterium]|nr:sugar phosphate nucleotidyltransferase [Deltaproteobacteria bacterium]